MSGYSSDTVIVLGVPAGALSFNNLLQGSLRAGQLDGAGTASVFPTIAAISPPFDCIIIAWQMLFRAAPLAVATSWDVVTPGVILTNAMAVGAASFFMQNIAIPIPANTPYQIQWTNLIADNATTRMESQLTFQRQA